MSEIVYQLTALGFSVALGVAAIYSIRMYLEI
jgi:hypothetical protein